jgi:hypothetical protein
MCWPLAVSGMLLAYSPMVNPEPRPALTDTDKTVSVPDNPEKVEAAESAHAPVARDKPATNPPRRRGR